MFSISQSSRREQDFCLNISEFETRARYFLSKSRGRARKNESKSREISRDQEISLCSDTYQNMPISLTVLLLKSFHTRRSFFLLTGRHNSLRKLTHYFSMFKEFPIKIFLLKSQKWRQLRQSNLPPLFAHRRSASY